MTLALIYRFGAVTGERNILASARYKGSIPLTCFRLVTHSRRCEGKTRSMFLLDIWKTMRSDAGCEYGSVTAPIPGVRAAPLGWSCLLTNHVCSAKQLTFHAACVAHTPRELSDDCPGLYPGPHVHVLYDGMAPTKTINGIGYLWLWSQPTTASCKRGEAQ